MRLDICECCETRPARRTIEVSLPGPGGYRWETFQSCLECNPGSPDPLRENGDRAGASDYIDDRDAPDSLLTY